MQDRISRQALRATVERLSAWNTRNTLTPECREALEWLAAEYAALPGMQVEIMEYILPVGKRVEREQPAYQLIATLPGDSPSIVALGAHLDSLRLGEDPFTAHAPGANDDASGIAACLEVARALAREKRRNTLKVFAFTGEEQGLVGAGACAARAERGGWDLLGLLNNDTVGNCSTLDGCSDRQTVRLFSATPPEGGQSRELARYAEFATRGCIEDFEVRLVLRRDRFWRGGDHTPFAARGFSAVRFTESCEEYSRQHTTEDTSASVDFEYLAKVAEANLLTARALLSAGPPARNLTTERAGFSRTRLAWEGEDGEWAVYWRATTSAVWEGSLEVGDHGCVIDRVLDDTVFGVGPPGGVPTVGAE